MKRKSALSLFGTVAFLAVVATALAQESSRSEKHELAKDVAPYRTDRPTPYLIPAAPSADNTPPAKTIRYYYKPTATPPVWAETVDPFQNNGSREEAELTASSHDLVQKLAHAESDSQRQELRNNLTGVLGKQFDLRQARHKQEIEALEAQVQKLRELVKKREENRSEIISRRLEQMVRDSQGLGF